VQTAVRRNRATSRSVFDFIRDVLLLRWPEDLPPGERDRHARFVMKFQQLTGPVMAKGVEDTAFYIFNRLISLNEVGGDPGRFGVAPLQFHRWVQERLGSWPLALNTTSTHDTKRSEDVRARINVLSEMPREWRAAVMRWAELNRPLKGSFEDGQPVPAVNDEYFFYQTLVGAWPLTPLDEGSRTEFVERMQAYMEKATREAKVHTSWIDPNEEYDAALRDFVAAALMGPAADGLGPFLNEFIPFQTLVARAGMLNSLSQTALKLTCPGVPDIYQGQEVWDLSLVDPDNRRSVDYESRRQLLGEIRRRVGSGEDRSRISSDLLNNWQNGGPKLYLIHLLLELRGREPELFRSGSYSPLSATGRREKHVIAFHRSSRDREIVVVVPRLVMQLFGGESVLMPDTEAWDDTEIASLAELLGGEWRGILSGQRISVGGGRAGGISVGQMLAHFPVEVLERVGG
jgi:(1->4)-alpha-D-glucan 1-alpha-D-glucosylmutase